MLRKSKSDGVKSFFYSSSNAVPNTDITDEREEQSREAQLSVVPCLRTSTEDQLSARTLGEDSAWGPELRCSHDSKYGADRGSLEVKGGWAPYVPQAIPALMRDPFINHGSRKRSVSMPRLGAKEDMKCNVMASSLFSSEVLDRPSLSHPANKSTEQGLGEADDGESQPHTVPTMSQPNPTGGGGELPPVEMTRKDMAKRQGMLGVAVNVNLSSLFGPSVASSGPTPVETRRSRLSGNSLSCPNLSVFDPGDASARGPGGSGGPRSISDKGSFDPADMSFTQVTGRSKKRGSGDKSYSNDDFAVDEMQYLSPKRLALSLKSALFS